MVRTTERASKLEIVVYDLEGKKLEAYDVERTIAVAGDAWFTDLANTLDHCRQTGLLPLGDVCKPSKRALKSGSYFKGDH